MEICIDFLIEVYISFGIGGNDCIILLKLREINFFFSFLLSYINVIKIALNGFFLKNNFIENCIYTILIYFNETKHTILHKIVMKYDPWIKKGFCHVAALRYVAYFYKS